MWKGLKEGLKPLSKGEEERLRRVFDRIDKDADGVISASAASAPYTRQTDARGTSDLRETLKDLQYETKKGEIEDMIWEVDEGLNNTVSYIEFNIMYCRIRQTDPFGIELRKLFTVCDFMMNDKNGDGCVTMDEAVQAMNKKRDAERAMGIKGRPKGRVTKPTD